MERSWFSNVEFFSLEYTKNKSSAPLSKEVETIQERIDKNFGEFKKNK